MCKWVKSGNQRIDPCMRLFIEQLKIGGAVPLACCCGHNRYSSTVVFQKDNQILAVAYNKGKAVILPRKRRFYMRDLHGYYYIPEIDRRLVTPQLIHTHETSVDPKA